MLNIAFRVDASTHIGAGHMMRCVTLAKVLRHYAHCHFVSADLPGNLNAWTQAQGFSLSGDFTHQGIDGIVFDHYGLDEKDERPFRQQNIPVIVIDDLANRRHDCDLLIDTNLLPEKESRYQGLLPQGCITLLGPQYALLRDEFYQPNENLERSDVLVCFGGTDPHNLTEAALDMLLDIKDSALSADLVIGDGHPAKARLAMRTQHLANIRLHIQTNAIATLMRRAKVMLGAGGSMHWERCISALPGLVITVADNQVATTDYLQHLGACEWLGHVDEVNWERVKARLKALLFNDERCQQQARVASELVPKTGGARAVAQKILTIIKEKR